MKRRYVVDVARCSPDDLMQNMISGWDAVVIHGSKRGCLYDNVYMIVETFFYICTGIGCAAPGYARCLFCGACLPRSRAIHGLKASPQCNTILSNS